MGIKRVELVPVSVTGPTTNIPAGKPDLSKFFQVSRTDTASTLKAVVQGSASIFGIYVYGSVASDAGTSAAVTLTVSDNSGVISTGSVNVLTNGATSALVQMSGLPNLEKVPANGDLKITAQYAEAGDPATTGGPWVFRVVYA